MTVTPHGSTVLDTGADASRVPNSTVLQLIWALRSMPLPARRVTGHINQARLRALENAHADQVEVIRHTIPAELDRYLPATAALP